MEQPTTRQLREAARKPYSFFLDADLVERARLEVGEPDVIRSIEAALAAVARLDLAPAPRILITGSLYLAGEVLALNGTPPA